MPKTNETKRTHLSRAGGSAQSRGAEPAPFEPVRTYGEHCRKWMNGCGNSICCLAKKCFARGTLPCDVLFIGEAPGECITGDSLVEVAFRDKSVYPNGVPIRDLVGQVGFEVYSYDRMLREVVLGRVSRVWKTGVKRVYRVSYFWWGAKPEGGGGRCKYYGSIEVTSNHPFLLTSGEYQSIDTGLTVGSRLQPFYRRAAGYHFIGPSSSELVKESRFLVEARRGPLQFGLEVHHVDRNKWNDSESNLVVMTTAEHARLHGVEDNPMSDETHRQTHKEAMADPDYRKNMSKTMKAHFADPEARKRRSIQNRSVAHKTSASVKSKFDSDPLFYYRYLCGRRIYNRRTGQFRTFTNDEIRSKVLAKFPGVDYPPTTSVYNRVRPVDLFGSDLDGPDNHQIYKIEDAGFCEVYDMEVDHYHNFAVNGIFVHNSEDSLGEPFVGPAGHLMDAMVARALLPWQVPGTEGCDYNSIQWAFSNLTLCVPRDMPTDGFGRPVPIEFRNDGLGNVITVNAETGDLLILSKAGEPTPEEVRQCGYRLAELIVLAKPRLIVCVGALSREWLRPDRVLGRRKYDPLSWAGYNGPVACVEHPAYILRANTAMKGLMMQKVEVTIRDAVAEIMPKGVS